MNFAYRSLGITFLAATACGDGTPVTSPTLAQGVFHALGGLRVGESLSLTGTAANEVLFGGQALPGDFVFIPFHASEGGSARILITLHGRNLSAPVAAGVAPREPGVTAADDAGGEMHGELHSRMQAEMEPLLLRRKEGVAPQSLALPSPRLGLSGTDAVVGQTVQLNANAVGPACSGADLRNGRVEALSQRAIIVADIDNPADGFSRVDYESIAADFDQVVHPTVTRFFGTPTDIDGNGRVIIFFTRAVNQLTISGTQGYVSGFFWSRDLFSGVECAASNEGEVVFVLVPDPNREASNIAHRRETLLRSTSSTIGHEYQHLINAGGRISRFGTMFEVTWLDEGLSHIAEELLFYAASGVQPRSNVGDSPLTPTANDALSRFMADNLNRYGRYLQNVTRESPTRTQDRLQTRGATWSFLRYVADHAPVSEEQLFRSIVASPSSGFANLKDVLGVPAVDWLQRWGVSVYIDDFVPTADPGFQQPSWHFRNLVPQYFSGQFPLRTEGLGPAQPLTLDIHAGTSGYVHVRNVARELGRVTTTSAGMPPTSSLRVTVVRTH